MVSSSFYDEFNILFLYTVLVGDIRNCQKTKRVRFLPCTYYSTICSACIILISYTQVCSECIAAVFTSEESNRGMELQFICYSYSFYISEIAVMSNVFSLNF